MSLSTVYIFVLICIIEGILLYWLFRRDKSNYDKEENYINLARKINRLLLHSSDSSNVFAKACRFLT